jgi:hypothetical protein
MRFITGFIISFLIMGIFVIVCDSIRSPRLNDNTSGGVTVLESVKLQEPAAMLPREPIIYNLDTMYIPRDIADEWNKAYIKNNDSTEIAFCLKGNGTVINESRPALLLYSKWDAVGINCSKKDIAIQHSHPENDCRVSYKDIVESQRDPTFATGVICDVNKFVFWRNGSFLNVAIVLANNSLEYITLPSNEAYLSE